MDDKNDPDAPEVLINVYSEAEASSIVTLLTENGIDARAAGGYTAGFRAEAPGYVNVLVKQADLKMAKKLLDESKPEIDWSQIDVGEPED